MRISMLTLPVYVYIHLRTSARARTHARTHARTQAIAHTTARAHTHAHRMYLRHATRVLGAACACWREAAGDRRLKKLAWGGGRCALVWLVSLEASLTSLQHVLHVQACGSRGAAGARPGWRGWGRWAAVLTRIRREDARVSLAAWRHAHGLRRLGLALYARACSRQAAGLLRAWRGASGEARQRRRFGEAAAAVLRVVKLNVAFGAWIKRHGQGRRAAGMASRIRRRQGSRSLKWWAVLASVSARP